MRGMTIIDSDAIERAAAETAVELVAKAQATLATFDLPYTGDDGARAAACATAGAAFVATLAQMAVHEKVADLKAPPCSVCSDESPHRHILPPSTAAAVKALADRAVEAFCGVVVACGR